MKVIAIGDYLLYNIIEKKRQFDKLAEDIVNKYCKSS